jgi:hypothetical protein
MPFSFSPPCPINTGIHRLPPALQAAAQKVGYRLPPTLQAPLPISHAVYNIPVFESHEELVQRDAKYYFVGNRRRECPCEPSNDCASSLRGFDGVDIQMKCCPDTQAEATTQEKRIPVVPPVLGSGPQSTIVLFKTGAALESRNRVKKSCKYIMAGSKTIINSRSLW